jgi:hypothetical protein
LASEQKIRELCEQVCRCEDDAQGIFLLAHLRLLIYDYIENLPDQALALPSELDAGSKVKIDKAA